MNLVIYSEQPPWKLDKSNQIRRQPRVGVSLEALWYWSITVCWARVGKASEKTEAAKTAKKFQRWSGRNETMHRAQFRKSRFKLWGSVTEPSTNGKCIFNCSQIPQTRKRAVECFPGVSKIKWKKYHWAELQVIGRHDRRNIDKLY